MKIGVFDSGVGGLSLVKAIEKTLPEHEVLYREDKKNLPYGSKTPEQLLLLVKPILEQMVGEGCKVILVACNTVTTTIIDQLRQQIKVPLVGMEPMVKPAAEQTKSGVIAVCATPTTLASKRYAWLKDTYAKDVKVLEPDCADWTSMIEDDKVDQEQIKQRIDKVCDHGADIILLGCTHYHWIEEIIREIAAGRAEVIQPIEPVISQLKRVIEQLA